MRYIANKEYVINRIANVIEYRKLHLKKKSSLIGVTLLNHLRSTRGGQCSSHFVDAESGSYLQRHQFLDEKLAGVRDAHLADGLGALADGAFKLLLSKVGLTDESACLTDVHLVAV